MTGSEFDENADDRELLRLYREASDERLPAPVAEAARSAWRRSRRASLVGPLVAVGGFAAALLLAVLPGPVQRPSPAEISWDPPATGSAPSEIGFDGQLQWERARMNQVFATGFDRDVMELRRRLDGMAVDARRF